MTIGLRPVQSEPEGDPSDQGTDAEDPEEEEPETPPIGGFGGSTIEDLRSGGYSVAGPWGGPLPETYTAIEPTLPDEDPIERARRG